MKNRLRFDVDALRQGAGEKAFARGERYFRDDLVSIVSLETKRVLAQVAGAEDYRCTLVGRGRKLEGECSCSACEDFGFCKHLVATALAANDASPEDELDVEAALRLIRRYLRERDNETLVDMLLGAADHDPGLFHRLNLAATALYGDEGSISAQLRKAIDGAIGEKIIDRADARRWAAGVRAALDNLADLATGPRAAHALELAERAMTRIGHARKGLGHAGDVCDDLLKLARKVHSTAVLVVRPEAVELARDLFARELDDQSGTFWDAASQYAEALGETGLAEYHRLAAEAWDNLPSLGRHAHVEHAERYANLLRILDYFAERAGDLEKRIALRAKDLSSPARYLGLAEFCLEQGRREEALRRGEEGLWMFEDDSPDIRLVLFVADLLMRAHRLNEAETCLWQGFQKRPALELYEALRSVSGADARRRAVPFLANRLAENGSHELSELLATVLLREEMFDEAWAAARTHGASPELLNELAQASASSHPREALDFYDSRIKYLAEAGGGQSYREIGSLLKRMAPLQGPSGYASYVAELKSRYERKRNLIRHLS